MEHWNDMANVFQYSDEALRFFGHTDRTVINDTSRNSIFFELEKLERTRLRNAATRSNISDVSVSKEDIGPSFRTTSFEFDDKFSFPNEEIEWQIENSRNEIMARRLSLYQVTEAINPNTIHSKKVKDISPLTTTIPSQRQNKHDDSYREYLTDYVTPILLNLIRHEDFEFGESSPSIELIETHLANRKYVTLDWFDSLYTQYYGSDENVFIGLLRIVEFIGKDMYPLGKTMAIAAIAHKNDEIKELGLRILEADCSVETLCILKNLDVIAPWLLAYVKHIISDFEQELCQC